MSETDQKKPVGIRIKGGGNNSFHGITLIGNGNAVDIEDSSGNKFEDLTSIKVSKKETSKWEKFCAWLKAIPIISSIIKIFL